MVPKEQELLSEDTLLSLKGEALLLSEWEHYTRYKGDYGVPRKYVTRNYKVVVEVVDEFCASIGEQENESLANSTLRRHRL